MNKTLVKIIAAFIPVRQWRKKARPFLENLDPLLFLLQIIKFSIHKHNRHKILLLEPNACHGEIVPGISKYFLDLGYKVDILLDYRVVKQRPFCRCQTSHINIFTHIPYSLKFIIRSKKLNNYDFICLLTTAYNASGTRKKKYVSFKEIYGILPEPKITTILIEHNIADVARFNETDLLKDGKIFTLAPLTFMGVKTPILNPHYFGKVSFTPLNKTVIFLVIGDLYVKFKNSSQLTEAVQKLVVNGLSNFRIWAVGRGQQKFKETIPAEILPFFSFKGEVNFPDLYAAIEAGDFILPLIDPEFEDNSRYITTVVSGTIQLILGFRKPFIMHKEVAAFYKFSDSEGITYSNGDLAEAMKKALHLSPLTYTQQQDSIGRKAQIYYDTSLRDLKKVIAITTAAKKQENGSH